MSEEMLVAHCAPTLAGIKSGNMFSCAYKTKAEFYREIRAYNHVLVQHRLRSIPLKYRNGRGLTYVYRPEMLRRDLQDPTAQRLLQDKGYQIENAQKCLSQLVRRFSQEAEFPHEVGLFLGYPAGDVKGFLENNGANAKLTGCWKVYTAVDTAKIRFAQYKRCTASCLSDYRSNHALERLLAN